MKILLAGVLAAITLTICVQAQSGPPALCKPCLFYGGDYDPTDPNSAIFYNEYTNGYGMTRTYGAVVVPRQRTLSISGILFQTMIQRGNALDPKGAGWEIRTNNIWEGGGTLVASGQGAVAMEATGRSRDGDSEYTISIKLNPPVEISGGTTVGTVYWFNLTPVCDLRNALCSTIQYFVSDTTQQANGVRATLQQESRSIINSDHYPYVWEDLCDAFPIQGCGYLSFGLMGTAVQ
jgi:hypothetical protein